MKEKRSKILLMLLMLIITLLFASVGVSADELLVPIATFNNTMGVCLPALVSGTAGVQCEAGWCGLYSNTSTSGIINCPSTIGGTTVYTTFRAGFTQSTYVSKIDVKNVCTSNAMLCSINYILSDGTILKTSEVSIAVSGVQSFTIGTKITSFSIVFKTGANGDSLEYKVWGTPAGGSIAWADITNKPTTIAGYGITDAASSSHAHTFASITSKPNTLGGYGITDAAASTHNHSGQTLAVNITGNALTANTATNATYATSAGNADTVDSKHAADFTVAGGTVAWSNVTGKPTTVEGYGITDGQRQMFTVIKGFKFDAYAVGSYTSPTGLATTSILSGAATKITGTLSTAGPTVVDCSSNKKLYFNVIEAPADDTTATVTFM